MRAELRAELRSGPSSIIAAAELLIGVPSLETVLQTLFIGTARAPFMWLCALLRCCLLLPPPAGLLAILVTGAVVTCCVLLTVLTCATLITLIVTGVPVGYAIIRLVMAARSGKPQPGFGSGTAAPGLFSGLFSGGGQQDEDDRDHAHTGGGGGAGGGGFGARMYGNAAGGRPGAWRFRADDADGEAEGD